MLTVFCVLYFVLSLNTSFAQSKGSSFVKMPFLQLDGDIIQAIAVPNILQCCWKCDRSPACLSLNVADMPTKDGLYECQMLTIETNKYSGLLEPSQHYHHYTRFTDQCAFSRCLNGGLCESLGLNDFRCHCPQGFTGKLCTISARTYKWLKINTSPVCFGAKGNSFGRFYIKENGSVTTVKLVHLSGYVSCDNGHTAGQSNWGCGPLRSRLDKLYTIITDRKNQVILPKPEFFNDTRLNSYEIPGLSSKSPELVYKNFTNPMDVAAGQEYRIWYGQDLKNQSENNNEGTSCTDVYMYGLFP